MEFPMSRIRFPSYWFSAGAACPGDFVVARLRIGSGAHTGPHSNLCPSTNGHAKADPYSATNVDTGPNAGAQSGQGVVHTPGGHYRH